MTIMIPSQNSQTILNVYHFTEIQIKSHDKNILLCKLHNVIKLTDIEKCTCCLFQLLRYFYRYTGHPPDNEKSLSKH